MSPEKLISAKILIIQKEKNLILLFSRTTYRRGLKYKGQEKAKVLSMENDGNVMVLGAESSGGGKLPSSTPALSSGPVSMKCAEQTLSRCDLIPRLLPPLTRVVAVISHVDFHVLTAGCVF